MDLPDPKVLIKLAAACRKAGITTFKGAGIEFTLEPKGPLQTRSKKQSTGKPEALEEQGEIETNEPTQEELLFWSAGSQEEQPQ